MAEPTSSIKSRIAALNIEQVHAPAPSSRPTFSYDQAIAKKKPPPPPPGQRPQVQQRQQTINNPPVLSNAPTSSRHMGNQPAPVKPEPPKRSPALPPRPPPRNNSRPPPGLPPRQPSEPVLTRRESNESIATVSSGISSLSLGSAVTTNSGRYQIRAPAYDPTTLPPLPTREKEDSQEASSIRKAMKSKSNSTAASRSLPPQLPSRPALPTRPGIKKTENKPLPARTRTLPPPARSALEFGLNKSTEAPPPVPTTRPSASLPAENGAPPPIPLASRPNLDAIMASKPKPGATGVCLICRDFSGPDKHAAQFPREHLPSSDAGWLANQLTAPFPSATDKARAIFVWLHHNVDYDVHSFFSGNISRSTPERTITSGLAVCEGYASLFAALALKAGLECVVVSGHGKGFGHSALQPGDPIPKFECGHAWNAVRIDNGEWKLIDACWGAGSLGCPGNVYNRHFTAAEFTKSNDDFGTTHFPEDNRYFFRNDGRIMTWEEYMMDDAGERLVIYGNAESDHGLGKRTFQPSMKHIKVNDPSDPVIRFQFSVPCNHWDHERNGTGKPYVMTLNIGGRDGRSTKKVPFNTDGKVWWLDINRLDLGAPGQKINVCAITEIDGKDARGATNDFFKKKEGRASMKWSSVSMWELV